MAHEGVYQPDEPSHIWSWTRVPETSALNAEAKLRALFCALLGRASPLSASEYEVM